MPLQLFDTGITCNNDVMVLLEVFVVVNVTNDPEPDVPNPISGFPFVQV